MTRALSLFETGRMQMDESIRRIGDREVVVSVSGGKDSAAACVLLRELGIAFTAIFMDTGWEHAATYRYIDEELEPRFGPIHRLRQPVAVPVAVPVGYETEIAEIETLLGRESPMVRLCVAKGAFPGQDSRWCTSCLKHVPAARWLASREETVNVVGIRRAESAKRKNALEWEAMPDIEVNPIVRLPGEDVWFRLPHVEQWRPLVDASEEDVVRMHQRHGLPLNPLYRLNLSRVGCWPCIYARKLDLRTIAETDPVRVEVLRLLERLIGQIAAARREGRTERKAMNPPAWFQIRDAIELARFRRENPEAAQALLDADFPGVRKGASKAPHLCVPIDRAIGWSKTARGGRRVELFAAPERDWACSRYGFCETGPDEDGDE